MRYLIWILMLFATPAWAQIPRNASGVFEYSQKMTVNTRQGQTLEEKAQKFFNMPFLVHWDSVTTSTPDDVTRLTGSGYVNVRAKYHGFAVPRQVAVGLQMVLEVSDSSYSYTINRFEVQLKDTTLRFPIENKPPFVSSIFYDQVVQKTHKRVSFIIGWMKRYMAGDMESGGR